MSDDKPRHDEPIVLSFETVKAVVHHAQQQILDEVMLALGHGMPHHAIEGYFERRRDLHKEQGPGHALEVVLDELPVRTSPHRLGHVAQATILNDLIALLQDPDLLAGRTKEEYRDMLTEYVEELRAQLLRCDDLECMATLKWKLALESGR